MGTLGNPTFTLEEWTQIFNGLESLEEFGLMERLFREDCQMGEWTVDAWTDVSAIARENLKRLQNEQNPPKTD